MFWIYVPDAIYVPDLYVLDLCSGSMFRVYVPDAIYVLKINIFYSPATIYVLK